MVLIMEKRIYQIGYSAGTLAPGFIALVEKYALNGYTSGGCLAAGSTGNLVSDTAVVQLNNEKNINLAAGFKFKLGKMDEDKFLEITRIELIV